MSIFGDDSSPAQLRMAAIERLTDLCPAMMRPMFAPIIETQINGMADNQINMLMADLDRVLTMAEAGDMSGVTSIATKWGATPEQIATVLPGFSA